jgi:nitroreductase
MTEQGPLAMPLEEAMRTQRSIRRVKSDPVDASLVLHLLELAVKAPTGSNAQNWKFIVVKDRDVVGNLTSGIAPASADADALRVSHFLFTAFRGSRSGERTAATGSRSNSVPAQYHWYNMRASQVVVGTE